MGRKGNKKHRRTPSNGSRPLGEQPQQTADELATERVEVDVPREEPDTAADLNVNADAVSVTEPSQSAPPDHSIAEQGDVGTPVEASPSPGEDGEPAIEPVLGETLDMNGVKQTTEENGIADNGNLSLDKLVALEEEYTHIVKERNDLKELLGSRDEHIRQMHSEREETEEKLGALSKDRDSLATEKSNLEKETVDLKAKLGALENRGATESSSLLSKVGGLEKELSDYKSKNAGIAAKLNQVAEEKAVAEKKASTMAQCNKTNEATIQELTGKLRTVQAERDSLRHTLEEVEGDLKLAKEENNGSRAQLQILQQYRDEANAKIERLQSGMQDMHNQLTSARLEVQDYKIKRGNLEDIVSSAQEHEIKKLCLVGLGGATVATLVVAGIFSVWGKRS